MSDLQARLQAALGDAYRIEKELGGGGMSRVFVAQEVELGRRVVVKVLPPEVAGGVNLDRFRREIQLAASLQHPHVVPLLTAGHQQELLYYTMPLIEGESLRAKLAREGALPVGDAVRILRDVVDALTYAHRHGVVHRDIKPDNVLVANHHAVVTDFGVAKAISESTGASSLTSVGVALGTPAYMAPEQAAADPHADHRCDLYSVGVLAYEMLTGRPPFTGASPQQVLAAQVSEVAVPVTKHRASVPPALAEAVMRCLEKNPADRWQTAEELLHLLEAMATPSGGTAPTAAVPAAPARIARRVPVAVAAGVGVVLLGVIVFLMRAREAGGGAARLNPNVVAVLPFRVTGADSGLRYLREGMVDLLAAKLTGEGGARAADPQSVMSAWRRATTAASGDLAQDEALRLARTLGAGQLLVGGIVGTGGRLVVSASTVAVPDGRSLSQVTVEGTPDSVTALVDRLAAQLLATGAGEAQQSLASLTTTSLPALRSYLDGRAAIRAGRYDEAARRLEQALQLDSTFALAGLALNSVWIMSAQVDRGLAVAWAARDRLSAPDRAFLLARAGPRYPAVPTWAEFIAGWRQATVVAPEAAEAWFELGDWILHHGAVLEMDGWQQIAAAHLRRAYALDSGLVGAPEHLLELAAHVGDTTAVRDMGARYLALDSTGDLADFIRWRVAQAVGDSAGLAALRARFDRVAPRSLSRIVGLAQVEGIGLDDAERAKTVLATRGELNPWAAAAFELNRGRPAAAEAAQGTLSPPGAGVRFPVRFRVSNGLYWNGDTLAARATAARLAATADAPLARLRAERAEQYLDICNVQIWRLAHRDLGSVDRATAVLRGAAEPADSAPMVQAAQSCALLLEAEVAAARGSPGAAAALERVDSLALTGPGPAGAETNLAVARLRETRGDLRGALAAVRRRAFHWVFGTFYLSTYLREEGRLAALTGDRAGAIKAYQHYLALRSDPEPALLPEVERVRAELARLVGEQGSR